MSYWDLRKKSAVEREKAAQRLDSFLAVTYLFPGVLHPEDFELMLKRENELTTIYQYSGRGFFSLYVLGFAFSFLRKGSLPFFKDIMKHTVLCIGGTYLSATISEKLACELYYNRLLFSLADKYNFTDEEVLDLQRNLNEYYIEREREIDIGLAEAPERSLD